MPKNTYVLLVSQDPNYITRVSGLLSDVQHGTYHLGTAESLSEAFRQTQSASYDVLLVDLDSPPDDLSIPPERAVIDLPLIATSNHAGAEIQRQVHGHSTQ